DRGPSVSRDGPYAPSVNARRMGQGPRVVFAGHTVGEPEVARAARARVAVIAVEERVARCNAASVGVRLDGIHVVFDVALVDCDPVRLVVLGVARAAADVQPQAVTALQRVAVAGRSRTADAGPGGIASKVGAGQGVALQGTVYHRVERRALEPDSVGAVLDRFGAAQSDALHAVE